MNFFQDILSPRNNRRNEKIFITTIIHSFNMIYILTNIFETKNIFVRFSIRASLMWNLVLLGKTIVAFPKP